ncbi:hypothetical protein L208DRAFT_1258301, partial [Tricholoma matsutake]
FLRDGRWARVFTPTITHALYISREPFLEWTSESPVFLATVQHIFNISFSNVTLVLSAKDPLLETAYKRVKSRKSMLASSILDAIKKFFETAEFADQPQKIRAYVRWALKPDGPAYYQIPTPQSCKADRNDPNYIAPDGFLQSKFIAPVADKFLGYAKNSVLQPALNASNPPKGLYALILTAVS